MDATLLGSCASPTQGPGIPNFSWLQTRLSPQVSLCLWFHGVKLLDWIAHWVTHGRPENTRESWNGLRPSWTNLHLSRNLGLVTISTDSIKTTLSPSKKVNHFRIPILRNPWKLECLYFSFTIWCLIWEHECRSLANICVKHRNVCPTNTSMSLVYVGCTILLFSFNKPYSFRLAITPLFNGLPTITLAASE